MQEQDFVLSLAEAVGLPSSFCRILSVGGRSSDKQMDVAFEVDAYDERSAENYARKIGVLIDNGQLALVFYTKDLPGAIIRSRPWPYVAGLPLRVGIAGESSFTGLEIMSVTKTAPNPLLDLIWS